MVLDLGDKLAQGRVCGNLGNVYYLLGDFSQALAFHQNVRFPSSHERIHHSNAIFWLWTLNLFVSTLPLRRVPKYMSIAGKNYMAVGPISFA